MKRVAIFIVLLGLLLSITGLLYRSTTATVPEYRHDVRVVSFPASLETALPVARPVYGLSLIPGGVLDGTEFEARLLVDPVLKVWFGACSEPAFFNRMPYAMDVFSTFRRDGSIRWSTKKIHVKEGETYLTRCGRTILTRCGNEISWTPQIPSEDVPVGILEHPVVPDGPTPLFPLTAVVTTGTTPLPPGTPGNPPSYYPPTGYPPCCGTTFNPPTHPPTPVPEPSGAALLLAGMLFCAVSYMIYRAIAAKKALQTAYLPKFVPAAGFGPWHPLA